MPAVLVGLLLAGSQVQAGIFSFGEKTVPAPANPSANSQTVGLSASIGLVGNAVGGVESLTIDGGALVPDVGPVGTMADIVEFPATAEISLYVVREDDTLSQIAEMFGVSVNTLIWANDLASSQAIQPGQTLVILPISGVRHTVAAGETLESIAKKYNGDLKEIIQFNGLEPSGAIAQGDVLIIPDGEAPTPSPRRLARGSPGRQPVYEGYYLRPIQGGIKTQGLHGYNGVDLATYAGAPIFAAADGKVIVSRTSGWNGGYGKYLVIAHQNGTQTLYAHNRENIVVAGQWVVKGQVISYVGSTGRTTGSHVHFEVRGAKNTF